MKFISVILLIFSITAQADTSLVIPLATTHIIHSGDRKYNNHNVAIGIETTLNNISYGITLVKKNSHNSRAIVGSILYKTPYDKLSIGLAVANGYEEVSSTGNVILPIGSIQISNFRIITTYPFSQLFCRETNCADIINIQYIWKF